MPDLPFLADTLAQLLAALPTTLELFALSVALGVVLACVICWMRLSRNWALRGFARGYIFVFRGSPLLIQMFLIYYGLGQFAAVRHSMAWPLLRSSFGSAVLALALCTAGYTAEIFRGAVVAVPAGEVEAARACGMSGLLLFRRILAPIALRLALPAYSTELVLMVKSTALASLLSVWEVTGVAQRIIYHTYRTMEVFLCAAAIYLTVNFVLLRALAVVERRLSPERRAVRAAAMTAVPIHA